MKSSTSLILMLLLTITTAFPIYANNHIGTRLSNGETAVLYEYIGGEDASSGNISTDPQSTMGHPVNDRVYVFASKIDTDSRWKLTVSRYGEILAEKIFQMTDESVIFGSTEYTDSNFTFTMNDFNFTWEQKVILQASPIVEAGKYVNPEYNLITITVISLGVSSYTQKYYEESLDFGVSSSEELTEFATTDDFTVTSNGVSIVSELSGTDSFGKRIYPLKIKVNNNDGYPPMNGFAFNRKNSQYFDLIAGYSAEDGEIPDSFSVSVCKFGNSVPSTSAHGKIDVKTSYFFTKVQNLFGGLDSGYYWVLLSFDYPTNEDGSGTGVGYQIALKITDDELPSIITEDIIPFSDIINKDWAKGYIADLVQQKVLVGYADGTFRPDEKVTRSEFAKMMVAGLKIPLVNCTRSSFVDITSDAWELEYVEAAKNFLTGFYDGASYYYKGDSPAVREDMSVALVRALQLENQQVDVNELKSIFSDWDEISVELRKYVLIAQKNGLIEGYPDGRFGPQQSITRAETAAMICKTINTTHMTKVIMADEYDDRRRI